MSPRSMLALALLAALLAAPASAWQVGRATHYGEDAWNIHKGSCGYGQLAQNRGTGWHVAALSDRAPDYAGSCGKCKEVRCKPMDFSDGYGAWLQRSNVCFDPSASVIVQITDTCPCYYPDNMFSNKRWCCGDMYHLDLSVWAYELLAEKKWGVIAVEWQDVDCKKKVAKPARNPWGQRTKMPSWYMPRPGWNRWMDKRPAGNYAQWEWQEYGRRHRRSLA